MKPTRNTAAASMLVTAAMSITAFAGLDESSKSDPVVYRPEVQIDQDLFEGNELFIDFYGAATRELIDDASGIGLGAGYYITRNIGFIFNATWLDDEAEFKRNDESETFTKEPDHSDASIFLGGLFRLPIDKAGIAWYGLAGVGGYVGSGENLRTIEFGGGLEARLTYHISGLLEVRYIEPESNSNLESETVFKVGLRYIF